VTDERTTEQRDADDQLHAAIERVVHAYHTVPTGSLITNWVVLGTGLAADGRGDLHQTFTLLPNDGTGFSPDVLLGILRGATLRIEHDYVHGDQAD
jgi:hypothetical protein